MIFDESTQACCMSPLRCVPRINNKHRLIVKLRRLNESCVGQGFRYGGITEVLDVVRLKGQLY